MATKARWTASSPDTLEWERPNSAGTQGSKHTCLLLVALQMGSASQKRNCSMLPEILNCLSLWTYWFHSGKCIPRKLHLLLPPCSKKDIYKIIQNKEMKNLYIFKGPGAPSHQNMRKKWQVGGPCGCYLCESVCGLLPWKMGTMRMCQELMGSGMKST